MILANQAIATPTKSAKKRVKRISPGSEHEPYSGSRTKKGSPCAVWAPPSPQSAASLKTESATERTDNRRIPDALRTNGEIHSTTNSHFLNTFDVKSLLGRGSSGVVYRCTHKLDRNDYAVKIVPIPRSNSEKQSTLSEVETFAKISTHKNILRYYHSWTETYTATDTAITSLLSCRNILGQQQSRVKRVRKFACQHHDNHIFVPAPQFPDRNRLQARGSLPTLNLQRRTDLNRQPQQSPTLNLLFIQMECPLHTLKDYLDGTLVRLSKSTALDVFSQIVKAVKHMHAVGYVHRDISQSNIFINCVDGRYTAMLGDFGVAVPIILATVAPAQKTQHQLREHYQKKLLRCLEKHSGRQRARSECNNGDARASPKGTLAPWCAVGTPGYSPPELGRPYYNQRNYDVCRNRWATSAIQMLHSSAFDMFSLSVILIELLFPFTTYMERGSVLTSWNKIGILPDEFMNSHPLECAMLRLCGSRDPADRPSAEFVDEWCAERLRQVSKDVKSFVLASAGTHDEVSHESIDSPGSAFAAQKKNFGTQQTTCGFDGILGDSQQTLWDSQESSLQTVVVDSSYSGSSFKHFSKNGFSLSIDSPDVKHLNCKSEFRCGVTPIHSDIEDDYECDATNSDDETLGNVGSPCYSSDEKPADYDDVDEEEDYDDLGDDGDSENDIDFDDLDDDEIDDDDHDDDEGFDVVFVPSHCKPVPKIKAEEGFMQVPKNLKHLSAARNANYKDRSVK